MCNRLQMGATGTGRTREDNSMFVPLHGETAPPIDASYYKGCGERNGIEREIIARRKPQATKMERQRSMDDRQRTDNAIGSAQDSGSAELHARSTDSVSAEYVARRLTPTECARLQGFPDDWCADVEHADSAEYKMWGNGIALPCIIPMMKAMGEVLRNE